MERDSSSGRCELSVQKFDLRVTIAKNSLVARLVAEENGRRSGDFPNEILSNGTNEKCLVAGGGGEGGRGAPSHRNLFVACLQFTCVNT